MIFREATEKDFLQLAEDSISRGIKEIPSKIDYVYAIEHDSMLLAIGGFKLMNESTAWCWMNWSSYALTSKIIVYRMVKEWIAKFCKDMRIKRIMAAVESDFPQAIATVEHLGFTFEAEMKCFFGEKTGLLFARIMEK